MWRFALRGFATGRSSHSARSQILLKRALVGCGIGAVTGFSWQYWINTYGSNRKIVTESPQSRLKPPTNVSEYPAELKLDSGDFVCLGTGVRKVTFLSFHVYAIGIYIGKEDIPVMQKILASQQDPHALLYDSTEKGAELMDELLRKCRFALLITPTRKVDLGHLRDGFVRTVTQHPLFRELSKNESVNEGLGQLRHAFSRKLWVNSDSQFFFDRDTTGDMKITFRKDSTSDIAPLGEVTDLQVSRLFLLRYLSGKKPNSPTALESARSGILSLLE